MWNEVKSDFSGLGLRLDDEDFDLEKFLTGQFEHYFSLFLFVF